MVRINRGRIWSRLPVERPFTCCYQQFYFWWGIQISSTKFMGIDYIVMPQPTLIVRYHLLLRLLDSHVPAFSHIISKIIQKIFLWVILKFRFQDICISFAFQYDNQWAGWYIKSVYFQEIRVLGTFIIFTRYSFFYLTDSQHISEK